MKPPPGAFLGGAKGRLLPASIPLRFFGAATVFHILAWFALAAGAAHWTQFGGDLGGPRAALHLVTLGVLAMTAIGAGAQLLPVATRRPAPGHRLLAAIWWLFTPGVAALALGMGLAIPALLAAGAAAVVATLAAWGVLMVGNLRGARGMPGVVAHGWSAMASLAVVLGSALALAATWLGWPAPARDTVLGLHIVFAPFGFMGLLAFGLSYILVPMFALADAPPDRNQLASCALAIAAIVLAAIAAPNLLPDALLQAAPRAPLVRRLAALLLGAAAVLLHLRLMLAALRTGMRPELGRSFTLVRIAWGGLLASLAIGAALVLDAPLPRLALLFGVCVVGVWLMSFLFGILQRILPFLASMHGATGRRARTPSALTHDGALRVHFGCHLGALALLALAIAFDSAWVTLAAAAVGSAGAIAFAVFFFVLLRRMRAPAR
ncbi:MAG TPA: hypothetical protein PLG77_08070 [Burkholderiaceae bacterium]|nr:hypothetical protein [Burkholderiaceae bacterium]